MDLSTLSDADLVALKSGDLSKVSDAGLRSLSATQAPQSGGFLSQIGDAANAFVHHAMNLPHGAAQFLENTAAGLALKVAPDSSIAKAMADTAMRDDAAMQQRESDYQSSVPNSTGSYVGATLGEIAPFISGGGLASGVKALGDAASGGVAKAMTAIPTSVSRYIPDAITNILPKMANGAVQGALVSAAAPVNNPDSPYGTAKEHQLNLGTITGAALPVAGAIGQSLYRGAKNLAAPIIDPQGYVSNAITNMANRAGVDPSELADTLRNAPEFVPGSTPTTAQAGAKTFLVQLEKAQNNNPEFKQQFQDLANKNNLARIAQLNEIAGQPGILNQLEQQRAAAAQQGYQDAYASGIDPQKMTPEVQARIAELLKRPAMQNAVSQAKIDIANQGLPLTDETSVQGLDYAKRALDKKIGLAYSNPESTQGLMDTRKELLDLADTLSDKYANIRQQYAELSKPINSMQSATQIINDLSGKNPNTSGAPQIELNAYRSALSKALKNAEYGIEPDKEAALNAIQDDLQRASISNSLRFPGSDTNYNFNAPGWLGTQVYGNGLSGKSNAARIAGGAIGGLTGFLSGGSTTAIGAGAAAGAGLMNSLSSFGANRVNSVINRALLDPSFAAEILTPQSTQIPSVMKNKLAQLLMQNAPEAISYEAARNAVKP